MIAAEIDRLQYKEEKQINDQHTIKITVHTGSEDLSDPNVLAEKLKGIQLR